MRQRLPVVAFLLAAAATPIALLAQSGGTAAPPQAGEYNLLSVFRESVKVGKGGGHDDLETAWAGAVGAAKETPFVAVASLTGPAENWYIAPYANWADYEKTTDANNSSPALATIDKRFRAQEDQYLSDSRLMILRARRELAYGPAADLPNMRYMSVTRIAVRPGHNAEFEEARKAVRAAHEKANMTDAYAMWQVTNGAPGGTYYMFVARKSLSEIDEGAAPHTSAAYLAALGGADGQKKLDMLMSNAILNQQTDLFEFKPAQSVPPEEWVKANPKMWQRKPVVAPKKPAAEAKKQ